MKNKNLLMLVFLVSCKKQKPTQKEIFSRNPIFKGWYADLEGAVSNNEYRIFLTFSANDIQKPREPYCDEKNTNKGRDYRVTSLDKLPFNKDGTIPQIKMTFKDVQHQTIN